MYLLLSTIGLTFNYIVLVLIPFAILYAATFRFILQLKAKIEKNVKLRLQTNQYSEEVAAPSLLEEEEAEIKEAQMNEPLSMETIKNSLSQVGWPLFNLSMVEASH